MLAPAGVYPCPYKGLIFQPGHGSNTMAHRYLIECADSQKLRSDCASVHFGQEKKVAKIKVQQFSILTW